MVRRLDREVQNQMNIARSGWGFILPVMLLLIASDPVFAGDRFNSSYGCVDAGKQCISSGIRTVDGFQVHRDCWEYSYTKRCNYPSKDNCKLYEHCYFLGNIKCLLQDSLLNCVNMQKEFSCKRWEPRIKENQTVRMDFQAKDGQEGLVCKEIPCIDGNCIDKSYMTNGEMMDSLSKLHASSNMKPDEQMNFKLFEGFASHCSKKAAAFSNCCQLRPKGWGKQLGAKCSKDEEDLADKRLKNLCVDVGQSKTKKVGVTTVSKEHFCCFGNMLEKVVQVEGRKQLGINFGSGGSPNCRGLTLEEIQKLDFSKMDFKEFIDELLVKFAGTYKVPDQKEIASRLKNSMATIRKYDNNPSNQDNNMTGWSGAVKDDSWEADEERRLEAAHIEQERQRQLAIQQEAAKLEAERIEQERQRQLAQKQLNLNRRLRAEKELPIAIKKLEAATEYWNKYGQFVPRCQYDGLSYTWNRAEWQKVTDAKNAVLFLEDEIRRLK